MTALFLCSLFVFTLAASSTFQMRTGLRQEQQEHARNLAESCLYKGIAKLNANASFGKNAETITITMEGLAAGSQGVLTFSKSAASKAAVGCSTYNLDNKLSVPGTNIMVPGQSVHLIAKGECGEARYQVETIYYLPAFPLGLQAGGEVYASGLFLSGLIEGVTPSTPAAKTPSSSLLPADIATNWADKAKALQLEGCNINGDVFAVGGIKIDNSSRVGGQVYPQAPSRQLPSLDILQARTKLLDSGVSPVVATAFLSEVDYFAESSGDLEIAGSLKMSGGILFVNGNLSVGGKVSGRGAILATGNVSLLGGAELVGQDYISIAARGDLSILGQGRDKQRLQGLVYSEGNLEARDIALVGTIISCGSARLNEVDILQTQTASELALGVPQVDSNGDDTFHWRIDPLSDPRSGEATFNYYWALYHAPGVATNHKGLYFLREGSGTNLSQQEVMQALNKAADSDIQTYQANAPMSQVIASKMEKVFKALEAKEVKSRYRLSFSPSEILSPAQNARLLMWRQTNGL